MYPLHPFTVHFPIALLLANGLLTWLALRRRQPALEQSAYHCLVLGWFGAVLALLSGLWDAWQQVYGPAAPRDLVLLNWVNAHAALGVAIVLVYGRALLQRRRYPELLADPQRRRGYLWLLRIGALLVLVDGWIGGVLVYTFGLGVRA
jgi:uncharacterized membrane protein